MKVYRTGNVTIMKHNLPEAQKEDEMRNNNYKINTTY